MKTSEILIVHPSEENTDALKAFLKALKIKFEVASIKPYSDDFVKIIQQGDEDIKNGKGKKITLDELDNLWK